VSVCVRGCGRNFYCVVISVYLPAFVDVGVHAQTCVCVDICCVCVCVSVVVLSTAW